MMPWLLLIFCLIGAEAQDHLGVRISPSGVKEVLQGLVKNHSGTVEKIKIPSNLYEIKIKQKDLISNPLIATLNEISNINLNKDLTIFLKTDELSLNGDLDQKSVKINISDVTSQGLKLKISVKFNSLILKADSLSLCEDRESLKTKKCGQGLKLNVSGLSLRTISQPLELSLLLEVRIQNGLAIARIISTQSNLDVKRSPKIDINFKSLSVPRISIVINGQETELDTSTLREKILEKKQFLSKKLLSFASTYIAGDLVGVLNKYLKDKSLSTKISILNKESKALDLDWPLNLNYLPADNTYVRHPILFRSNADKVISADDIFETLMRQLSDVIRQAKLDLTIKKINSLQDQSLEIRGLFDFILNHGRFEVGDTLGNGQRKLPQLDMNNKSDDHILIAISEPVINGALDLANSTGLFQEMADELIKEKSLSLKSVRLHFFNPESFKLITNLEIDLKKLRTNFWKNPIEWAETEIGIWLERNNNNSVIYFPLEFEIVPVASYSESGEAKISIKIRTALKDDLILNTYNYPSNVGQMFQMVRKAVIKKLQQQLDSFENKNFELDITKFTSDYGIKFKPKTIKFEDKAYILLGADIVDVAIKKD
jgi:hypothetical protein